MINTTERPATVAFPNRRRPQPVLEATIGEDLDGALKELLALRAQAASTITWGADLGSVERSMDRIRRNFDRALIGLDGLAPESTSLVEEIDGRLRRFQASSGVTVSFQHRATWSDRLQGDDRRHLLAILGEALHNVRLHADALSLEVTLNEVGRRVVLTVCDDGIGPHGEGSRPGFGQRGMQERASLLEGCLTIDRAAQGGTCVTLIFPWEDRR